MNAVASGDPAAGALPRWQRWLLPAVIGTPGATRDADGGTRLPRSVRDWVVDIVFFAFALVVCFAELWANHRQVGTTVFVLDAVCGVPACLLIWVRRRHPLAVGFLAVALSTVSEAAGGAAIVGLFTVAVHGQPRRTVQVALLSAFTGVTCAAIYTRGGFSFGTLFFWLVATVAVVAFGSAVRARRELLLSLQERARRAEDEQHLRVREAQLAERARIAREMHDVLAHRISLLSVHAGALEFNPSAAPEEIARAAGVIRVSARAAQEELREVIGVLRAGLELEDVQPPQPTIADLATLVEESRAAGMDVSFKDGLRELSLSPILGRTVYRVVQEALTNARKHAAGQVVTITLDGDRAAGVRAEVVNRPWVGQAGAVAGAVQEDDGAHVGSGTGLVGLNERVTLVGGRLVSERLAGGGFKLMVTLPWTDAEADEEASA
ncbi:MAG: sensor histidine kinase [Acidobacteriota bacterium]|nr:sensor histidine kinase [Acidobacteriota bacterium]